MREEEGAVASSQMHTPPDELAMGARLMGSAQKSETAIVTCRASLL